MQKVREYKLSWILLFWGVFVFLIPKVALGDESLTDAQKKETVYEMYNKYRKGFPNVPEISPQEAMKLLEVGQIIFVDVRKEMEREVSMLPNAITEEEYLRDPSAYKHYTVVAYCTIGNRSGIFARDMASEGVGVRNLRGGILAWVHEGNKVYDRNVEVRRIHVLGKKWDYPPQGYESVKSSFWGILFNSGANHHGSSYISGL